MKRLIFTLIIIGYCALIAIVYFQTTQHNHTTQPPATLQAKHGYKYVLNYNNVYAEIMRLDIKFSEKVLRQTIIESGHYKSHNCLKRNNITGMKGGEATSDNPEGYAIFETWMDCLVNYKAWQKKRLTDACINYYQFLQDWGYHEGGDEYEKKCEGVKLIIVRR